MTPGSRHMTVMVSDAERHLTETCAALFDEPDNGSKNHSTRHMTVMASDAERHMTVMATDADRHMTES